MTRLSATYLDGDSNGKSEAVLVVGRLFIMQYIPNN
jgi:hypothetical protein